MKRKSQQFHKHRSRLDLYQKRNERKGRRKRKRRKNPLAFPDATPTRRISTAAGQRLEEILETSIPDTVGQGRQLSRAESPGRFLSTSKYLSLLGEESDKAASQNDNKTGTRCLPPRILISRSADSFILEKGDTEGNELGEKHLLLRQKRRRLAITLSILFVLVAALAIGLAVGLSNNSKK